METYKVTEDNFEEWLGNLKKWYKVKIYLLVDSSWIYDYNVEGNPNLVVNIYSDDLDKFVELMGKTLEFLSV